MKDYYRVKYIEYAAYYHANPIEKECTIIEHMDKDCAELHDKWKQKIDQCSSVEQVK